MHLRLFAVMVASMVLSIVSSAATPALETDSLPVSTSFSPRYSVYCRPIGANIYLEAGMDMALQNPYGYNFAHVFPNGKTFGLDAAVGKWFTPALGLRLGVNWENGIKLLENQHANWLAPFDQPGVNMHRGGYITGYGDVQLDIINLIDGYKPDRHWGIQPFMRAGALYNFGVSKGSPLLGLGLGATYSINDRWGVYADACYQFVSSGHVGTIVKPTGTGTGSNGFMDINVGVSYRLPGYGFSNVNISDLESLPTEAYTHRFIDDWYVRLGLDMTLHNPYGKDFSQVFPKGKVFGVDLALGKWFTDQIGLRLHLLWDNGIKLMRNRHLQWLAPAGANGINMDRGGYVLGTLDVPFSLSNIIMGPNPVRPYNLMCFARAGLISNRATKSVSPSVGGGLGATWRMAPRWHLYADLSAQTTTSEFYGDVANTGMSVSTGFNCFFTLECGVQFDL